MLSRSLHATVTRFAQRGAGLIGAARHWLGGRPAGADRPPLLGSGEIAALLHRLDALGHEAGARRPVHARPPGEAESPHLGRGLDFEELRPYGHGDDLRDVDWRAFARSGRVFVRRYREERQAALHVVFDRGPSMRFGTHCRLKVAQAARTGVLYALAAMRRGAVVGVTTLGPDGRHLRGRPGRGALLHAVEELVRPCPPLPAPIPSERGELSRQLGDVEALAPAGARILLLSDFRALREDDLSALARLARRHAVLAVGLEDDTERRLPDLGPVAFAAPAAGQVYAVDTGNAALREDFARRAQGRREAVRRRLERLGIAVAYCSTCEDVFERFAGDALYG